MTWKEDVWPWIRGRLESVQWAVAFLGVILGLVTGGIGVYWRIKSQAQSAVLDDPKFLERLAERVRPVCLLSSKGYFYDDYGGLSYIEQSPKIEVGSGAETIAITIRAKQFLRQPPLLTSVDGSLYLMNLERVTTESWRYTFGAVVTHVDSSMGYHQLIDPKTVYLFRVEVLH